MDIAVNVILAGVGGAAFALLFNVPGRYLPGCFFCGAIGWGAYELAVYFGLSDSGVCCFVGSLLVTVGARFFAVKQRCPAIVFLIAGIIPLVPGVGMYRTVLYFVTGELEMARINGYEALKEAVGIAIGIIFVMEVPKL